MSRKINKYAKLIKPYIINAPDDIQKAFYNYPPDGYDECFYSIYEPFIFKGLLFKENKVYCLNIYVHDKSNNFKPRYLEVTQVFDALLNSFNILHTALIISKSLKKYYRESTLAENIIPHLINHNDSHKPKFKHRIKKHKARERLFVENYRYENNREWNKILLHSIVRIRNCNDLKNQRNKRPNARDFIYKTE